MLYICLKTTFKKYVTSLVDLGARTELGYAMKTLCINKLCKAYPL